MFFQGAIPPEEVSQRLAKPTMQFVSQELRVSWKNDPQLASLTADQFSRVPHFVERLKEFVGAPHRGPLRTLTFLFYLIEDLFGHQSGYRTEEGPLLRRREIGAPRWFAERVSS